MTDSILVTGANGNIGSLLIPALCANPDLQVRALVRDLSKGAMFTGSGAEVMAGDFADLESLKRASNGIDTVVLIAPPGPDCVAQNRAVIDAALATGVRKIVRISAIKADENGRTENTRLHGHCDRQLQESGLNWVILRPNYYMQNIFMSIDSIISDDAFYSGMGDGRLAMVDVRDVAAATAVVSSADEFDNRIVDLSGPASISFADMANILSELLGRPVNCISVTPEALKQALLQLGFDEWMADLLREYSEAYGEGWGDLVTDGVLKVTGQAPCSFRKFAEEVFVPALP
jgi:uncharacterized protein YbjT (DUF2867 family)